MPQQLIVGAVIVDSLEVPTRVLATKRSKPGELAGFWEFPGGKVERDEAPEAALVREVTEELDVPLRLGLELVHRNGAWPISDRLALRLFFAEIIGGRPTPGDSHDEVRWLAPHELTTVRWLPADEAALPGVAAALDSGGSGQVSERD